MDALVVTRTAVTLLASPLQQRTPPLALVLVPWLLRRPGGGE
jgi:hypothetical protein